MPKPDDKPVVELTHWWNYPGKLAALEAIRSAVETRGARFIDTKMESWDKVRSTVINRLNIGYPPAISQWLADPGVQELSSINTINSAPTKWKNQPLEDILLKEVYKNNTKNGKLLSLPIGIHIQNSALFNAEIYQELKLELPKTWQQFLEQAAVIQQAGYIPLALSKEMWQLNILFNTILLENIGQERYPEFYAKTTMLKNWRKEIEESFDTLLKLKAYADEEHTERTWNEAVKLIGQKKAAMHVLGDFAKGELTAMGLEAGKDFLCSLSPGPQDAMVYAVDIFLMLKVNEPELLAGQKILFESILDPQVQADFNKHKGSLPIRYGVDIEKLDSCSRTRYEHLIDPDKALIKFSGTENPMRASVIQGILAQAWANYIAPSELTKLLIESDELANTHKMASK